MFGKMKLFLVLNRVSHSFALLMLRRTLLSRVVLLFLLKLSVQYKGFGNKIVTTLRVSAVVIIGKYQTHTLILCDNIRSVKDALSNTRTQFRF